MNPYLEKEFKNPIDEIEDAEFIEIQPKSETLSGLDNQKPLSRLKLQRQKEKELKLKRRVKQSMTKIKNIHRPKVTVPKTKISKQKEVNFDKAVWEEAKELSLIVNSTINEFANIAVQAIAITSLPNIDIADEGKEMITSRTNIVFSDVENLRNKWVNLTSPMENKNGIVDMDSLPLYLAIYEDLLTLNQDVLNVLTDPCTELSEMINLVFEKSKASTESNKE